MRLDDFIAQAIKQIEAGSGISRSNLDPITFEVNIAYSGDDVIYIPQGNYIETQKVTLIVNPASVSGDKTA